MRYLVGIGLWALWIVLLVLKVTGVLDIPWLAVWAPLWAPALLAVFGSGLALLWVLGGIALRGGKPRAQNGDLRGAQGSGRPGTAAEPVPPGSVPGINGKW